MKISIFREKVTWRFTSQLIFGLLTIEAFLVLLLLAFEMLTDRHFTNLPYRSLPIFWQFIIAHFRFIFFIILFKIFGGRIYKGADKSLK